MIETQASNQRVREILINMRDNRLIPRPEFQRRLVWTAKDKDKFIDTVLRGYPFPEIYICNGEVNIETGEGTLLLVDGLQRVNTLFEYFNGNGQFTYTLTAPYVTLTDSEKNAFLQYSVVVRDLGTLSKEQIIDVFRRLNSTQYTLRDMEVNNAVYNGELKMFCQRISESEFFEEKRLFSATDRRRMGDVSYCLTLVGTMMLDYFNRDEEHENLLLRFNESFPEEVHLKERFEAVFDFITECGFDSKSRLWKKADFLSLFIELDRLLATERVSLDPLGVLNRVEDFFRAVNENNALTSREKMRTIVSIYARTSQQATNDRLSRLRRGLIIRGILMGWSDQLIEDSLDRQGVLS
jgi:hypothetical protein